jgi:hypothetical protein
MVSDRSLVVPSPRGNVEDIRLRELRAIEVDAHPTGVRRAPVEVLEPLNAGEAVDPDELELRTHLPTGSTVHEVL